VLVTVLLALLAAAAGRLCQKGWQVVIVFGAFLPLPFLPAFAAYARNVWLPVAPPEVAVALSLVGALILSYALEGRQKRFIKTAFKQYLSPAVIEELNRATQPLLDKLGPSFDYYESPANDRTR
jgi:adenylate cyclase